MNYQEAVRAILDGSDPGLVVSQLSEVDEKTFKMNRQSLGLVNQKLVDKLKGMSSNKLASIVSKADKALGKDPNYKTRNRLQGVSYLASAMAAPMKPKLIKHNETGRY